MKQATSVAPWSQDQALAAEAAIGGATQALGALDGVAKSFGRSVTSAFTNGIVEGKKFQDVVKQVGQRLEAATLNAAMKPLGAGLSTLVVSSLAGLGSAALSGGSALLKGLGLFADGGVVNAPTWFPHAQGLGVAGEAGPEAILPLARGSDGKLGVRAGAGGTPAVVTVHIATPDPEAFRRSESLVSASLARAVARGQRGL
ncbi:MAG: phage tail tape measure protein [Alsobacter sp.]